MAHYNPLDMGVMEFYHGDGRPARIWDRLQGRARALQIWRPVHVIGLGLAVHSVMAYLQLAARAEPVLAVDLAEARRLARGVLADWGWVPKRCERLALITPAGIDADVARLVED